jgi:hypothetical protein
MTFRFKTSITIALLLTACAGTEEAAPTDGLGEICRIESTCEAWLMCVGGICTQESGPDIDAIVEIDIASSADTGPETATYVNDWTALPDTADDALGNEIKDPEPWCGNSVVEGDEACDEGAVEPLGCAYGELLCLVCNSDCEMVGGMPSYCGDGLVDEAHGEQCDDGNNETESCPGMSDYPCTVCQAGCIEGAGEVDVSGILVPDNGIVVELVWTTPSDPDPLDEGPETGADLDLHFLHPAATGQDVDGDGVLDGWFDQPFDCFWFNTHPNWGVLDPLVDDDPAFLVDDDDGAGPEIVAFEDPNEELTYRVGVHYWSDHGYGTSYATVRVFLQGALVFEMAEVELADHDFWEVATIDAGTGLVTPITNEDGDAKIIPNYQHPYIVP